MNRPALDLQAERDQCSAAAFRLRVGPEPVRTGFRKPVGESEDTIPEFRMDVIENCEVLRDDDEMHESVVDQVELADWIMSGQLRHDKKEPSGPIRDRRNGTCM